MVDVESLNSKACIDKQMDWAISFQKHIVLGYSYLTSIASWIDHAGSEVNSSILPAAEEIRLAALLISEKYWIPMNSDSKANVVCKTAIEQPRRPFIADNTSDRQDWILLFETKEFSFSLFGKVFREDMKLPRLAAD